MAPDTRGRIYLRLKSYLETGSERDIEIRSLWWGVCWRHAMRCCNLASLHQFVGLELEDELSWKTTEVEVLAIRCREGRRRNEGAIDMVD